MPEKIVAEVENARREVRATHESIDRLSGAISGMVPRHEAVANRLWWGIGALTLVLLLVVGGSIWREARRENLIDDLTAEIDCRSLAASNLASAEAELLLAKAEFDRVLVDVLETIADPDQGREQLTIVLTDLNRVSNILFERENTIQDAVDAQRMSLENC